MAISRTIFYYYYFFREFNRESNYHFFWLFFRFFALPLTLLFILSSVSTFYFTTQLSIGPDMLCAAVRPICLDYRLALPKLLFI